VVSGTHRGNNFREVVPIMGPENGMVIMASNAADLGIA
jgi:hypothetical protein